MKIKDAIFKVISDTHTCHSDISGTEADVLIHCGDAGNKGSYTELESFLYWFVKQPAKYKIYVPGNHDKKIKTHPDLQKLAKDLGIIILRGEGVCINGIQIWGGDLVPSFDKVTGKCRLSDEECRNYWEKIPEDLDILITHVPPKGILSKSIHDHELGCKFLLEEVLKKKPRKHFFGHIHEFAGETIIKDGVLFHNACAKNRDHLTVRYEPKEFKIPWAVY